MYYLFWSSIFCFSGVLFHNEILLVSSYFSRFMMRQRSAVIMIYTKAHKMKKKDKCTACFIPQYSNNVHPILATI